MAYGIRVVSNDGSGTISFDTTEISPGVLRGVWILSTASSFTVSNVFKNLYLQVIWVNYAGRFGSPTATVSYNRGANTATVTIGGGGGGSLGQSVRVTVTEA